MWLKCKSLSLIMRLRFSRKVALMLIDISIIYMWQLAHNRAAFVTKHLITSSVYLTLNVLMRGSVITCSWPSHPFSWTHTPGLVLPKTASTVYSMTAFPNCLAWIQLVPGCELPPWRLDEVQVWVGNHLNNMAITWITLPIRTTTTWIMLVTRGWQIGCVKVVSAFGNVFHLN